jgi:hypothetical protein
MSEYISEKAAIKKLAEITNQEINETLMIELATYGVIPAYIKFRPKDKATYPGKSFSFVAHEDEELTVSNSFETELQTLPFPLREGGIFRAAEWAFHGQGKLATLRTWDYQVMVARSDGQLDCVSDQHIARFYTLPELRQSKQNVIQYIETGKYQRAIHSYCEAFAGFDIETVGEWQGMSPFTDDPDYFNPKKRLKNKSNQDNHKSTKSELIIISAMLQIIKNLSKQPIGREYKQHEITALITKNIFRGAIEARTINGIFAKANEMQKELAAEAE